MGYEKIVIGLASVLAGWLLAQFTGILKDFLRLKKINKCLLEELKELESVLERTLLIYSRMLQIYSQQGIDNGVPSPLSNHIFTNYYKDAVLGLNKEQRISYQLIHTLVGGVNSGMLELREVTSNFQEKNITKGSISIEDVDLWGNKVISEFNNVAAAIWHIRYHLQNPNNPNLSTYAKSHGDYLKYLENVENRVSEIIKKAKNIPREKFENTYNPETFAKEIL